MDTSPSIPATTSSLSALDTGSSLPSYLDSSLHLLMIAEKPDSQPSTATTIQSSTTSFINAPVRALLKRPLSAMNDVELEKFVTNLRYNRTHPPRPVMTESAEDETSPPEEKPAKKKSAGRGKRSKTNDDLLNEYL